MYARVFSTLQEFLTINLYERKRLIQRIGRNFRHSLLFEVFVFPTKEKGGLRCIMFVFRERNLIISESLLLPKIGISQHNYQRPYLKKLISKLIRLVLTGNLQSILVIWAKSFLTTKPSPFTSSYCYVKSHS